MVPYRPTKVMIVMSIVGTTVGGLVFFKDYVGGTKYDGKERLVNKTVIITGANSGIGKETARDLARRGARVILACRDLSSCEAARKEIVLETKNRQVLCQLCDLASLQSIRQFSDKINKEESQLHILINNAGIMRCPKTLTADGFEMQLGVNHLGHFLLTNLLLDKLKASAPSRIINVSSVTHERGEINFDDLNSDKCYDEAKAYNQSKLANVLFTKELSKQLQGTGITTYAVHPGIVDTNIMRHMGIAKSYTAKIMAKPFLWLFTKTPKQGAQTVIYCSLDANLQQESGRYYSNCKERNVSQKAQDESAAKRLWNISEKWTKLK